MFNGGGRLETEIVQITCPHCGSTWTPRVPNPKTCPQCKRPLHKTEKQLQREAQVREAALPYADTIGLVSPTTYSICNECLSQGHNVPAVIRLNIDGKKRALCKEHAIQTLEKMNQPTTNEVMERVNQLSHGEIPEELQNLK